MYQALYRKYRPKTLDEVVGQKVIVKTLSNGILNNKISHAYLFTGPRGTGKTSIAKILAKIVNCESLKGVQICDKCVNCTQTNKKQNTDIIEIDAASNNGVDEIRDLRDKVSLVPTFGKYKVYIIDEVHMLTTSAFNALLKTLEEPPSHIIFILATTEPHKIPQTILSRCQRFDFKKISTKDIESRLKYICEKEKIKIEDDALSLIANLSDGGMRDSIGLLDQLTSFTNDKITIKDVNDVYGVVTNKEINNLLKLIYQNNMSDTFNLIEQYDDEGKNLAKIIEQIILYLKNILIYINDSSYFENKEEKKMYDDIVNLTEENKIFNTIEILLETLNNTKTTNNVRLIFELAIIKILNKEEITKIKEEIPVLKEKKTISIEKKIEPAKVSSKQQEKINNLKQIRINNTLSKFDKKDLINFKKDLDMLNELLMDPDYSSYVSLLLDGELKAKGEDYLLFVYKLENFEEKFNQSLIELEQALKKTFNQSLKPIAITEEEWEPIKKEFNKNLKEKNNVYIFKEEIETLEEIYELNKKENNSNEIDEMFDEIVEYN